MENSFDRLQNLVDLKKEKKKPNNSQKAEFSSLWAALVEEEGFSDKAEYFLYNGYSFCGVEPFYKYMETRENPNSALEELYNGKLYRENCGDTTAILIHLLTLSLNDEKQDLNIIASLMDNIPSAMENKEGKLYGKADVAFKKYMFDELKQEASLPEISELQKNGLSNECSQSLADIVESATEKTNLAKCSESCRKNIQRIKEWLPGSTEEVRLADQAKLSELEAEKDRLEQALKSSEERINNLQEIVGKQKVEMQQKDDRINELVKEDEKKQLKIEEIEKQIESIQEESDRRAEMVDMLRRDRKKQSEESLHRLTAKLRTYSQDYQDAKNLEMTIELGENIRDQFGEVLKIINSAISADS